MVIDKAYIEGLRVAGISINEELEQILLNTLGIEPKTYEYTEQDISEQSRKIIRKYKENSTQKREEMLTLSQRASEDQRKDNYEDSFYQLQQAYDEAQSRIKELEGNIEILKELLTENFIKIPELDGPLPF
jgi:chromosome segregation ATPase